MPAYSDLVHQTTTGTGTGNLTLATINGKRTFLTAFGTGGTNTFDYFISHQTAAEWERGTGHEASGALVRDTVLASSNSGAAVNFSAGTKDITNDQPAGKRVDNTRTITSGSGLTGGGDLSADRTLAVGAGTGIVVNTDDVAIVVPVTAITGGTGQTAYTLGDMLYASSGTALAKLAGSTNASKRFLSQTGNGSISAAPAWSAITTGDVGITPAALTKTDDTNVTLALGGTPTTALLQATSITVGWSGTLAVGRGGTGASSAGGALTALGAAASARLITSGGGLTGGGDLSADRTLAVGAGTGITVNADDVAINTGANFTWTGTHYINNSTASSSAGTGALTVAGGVGIGGQLFVAGLAQFVTNTAANNYAWASTFNGLSNIDFNYQFSKTNGVAYNGVFIRYAQDDATPGTESASINYYLTANATFINIARLHGGGLTLNAPGALTLNATSTNPVINYQRSGTLQFSTQVDSSNNLIIPDADASHGVYLAQNSTAWAAYSDGRLASKQNARTVSGLLERLDSFRLIEHGEDHRQIGVIAQELHNFMPQLVQVGDDIDRIIEKVTEPGVWGVLPSEAAFVALQVGRELYERLRQIERRVEKIERSFAAL